MVQGPGFPRSHPVADKAQGMGFTFAKKKKVIENSTRYSQQTTRVLQAGNVRMSYKRKHHSLRAWGTGQVT